MTSGAGDPGRTGVPDGGAGAGVWLLALGQTTGYVAQTFVFAALIVALNDPGTGARLSGTMLAAGPTCGLLLAALAAPFSGRLIDRGHGARMLTLGPLFSAVGLCLAAMAAGNAALWIGAFLVIGLGQATTQFETCFAFLTRRLGHAARAAIVRVTLVAGFSTTLAFPLGDALNSAFGWRGALVALAVGQIALTLPLNLAGTRLVRRRVGHDQRDAATADARRSHLRSVLRGRAFWLLAGLLGLIWLNHAVLTTFALPILMNRGAGHDIAVMLAAALGPAQVAGRLMLVMAGDRLPLRPLTMWTLAGFVCAGVILAVGQDVPTLWLLYALVQGASAGVASILRPLLAAEVLGREGFGSIWGALSVAPLIAQATAPVLGAVLLDLGGAGAVIFACLGMALGAGLVGLALRTRLSAA